MLSYQIFNERIQKNYYHHSHSHFYSRFNALILPHPFFRRWTYDMRKKIMSHIFPRQLTEMRMWMNFFSSVATSQLFRNESLKCPHETILMVNIFCVIIIGKIVFQNNQLNVERKTWWWVGRKDAFYTHDIMYNNNSKNFPLRSHEDKRICMLSLLCYCCCLLLSTSWWHFIPFLSNFN